MKILVLRGAVRVDGGADDPHLVRSRHDFEAAALQGAHFDHFMYEPVQQPDVNEFHIRAVNENHAGPLHVDVGGGGCRQSAVTKRHKFGAACVTRASIFEHFFGLQVQEAHAHGPAPENAFQVPAPAASTEIFLGVQGDHGVPTLPDPFAGRIAPEAHSIPQRPHAGELIQFSLCRRNSRGHDVCIIEQPDRNSRRLATQGRRQCRLQCESLYLLQVGRILHDPSANDAREADSDCCDLFSVRNFLNLLPDTFYDAFRGHRLQRVQRLRFFRKNIQRADDLVAFHQANGDVFHNQYTNCPAHRAPTNLKESKIRAIDSSLVRDYGLTSLFRPLNAAAL